MVLGILPPSLSLVLLGFSFLGTSQCHVVTTLLRTRSSPWSATDGHHPKNWFSGIPTVQGARRWWRPLPTQSPLSACAFPGDVTAACSAGVCPRPEQRFSVTPEYFHGSGCPPRGVRLRPGFWSSSHDLSPYFTRLLRYLHESRDGILVTAFFTQFLCCCVCSPAFPLTRPARFSYPSKPRVVSICVPV